MGEASGEGGGEPGAGAMVEHKKKEDNNQGELHGQCWTCIWGNWWRGRASKLSKHEESTEMLSETSESTLENKKEVIKDDGDGLLRLWSWCNSSPVKEGRGRRWRSFMWKSTCSSDE